MRLLVLVFVGICYFFSFPAILLIEITGLVVVFTAASFFVDQETLKRRFDGLLISFSGAVLLEDIWYWLQNRTSPRQTTQYKDYFRDSIEPEVFPIAVPIASLPLAAVFYVWLLSGGYTSIWFYLVFTIVSIVSVAVTEGRRFEG